MIVDPTTAPFSQFYGLLIRSVVPRPIAWVSSVSRSGDVNLAPFSFFNAVSADPPVLCFSPGSRPGTDELKDTALNVRETGEFVVNVVTEELAERMNETATDFPHGMDEFEQAGLTPLPSERVRPPRVAESPLHFECTLRQTIPMGRNVLVLGNILLVHVDERVLREGKVDPDALRAVGRMGAMEYTRTRDRFTLVRRRYRG